PDTRWPRPGQPLRLHLDGPLPAAPPTVAALAGGPALRLALRQDPRLPEWSTARFWPPAPGWYQITGPGNSTFRFYVYPLATWAGPENHERREAARAQAATITPPLTPRQRASIAADLGRSAQSDTPPATINQPWPTGWFFALFLLAAGYLWLEEKL
ncbi:MAG: hypothetical protein M3Y54_22195, partial [Bacteroidota bacterium]|nr:hypothetical protein [Bacteroidota bacterium]